MNLIHKNILKTLTLSFFSKGLIGLIKEYKKGVRERTRFMYGNGLAYVKHIDSCGVTFSLVIDPYQNGGVDENIAKDGVWEPEISKVIIEYIKPNGIFIDIGANIGYHSLFVASYLQNTGKVYSFEPICQLVDQLNKSIAINKFTNIEVYNFGLANKQDKVEIYIRDENAGGSSIINLERLEGLQVKRKQDIFLKKLDDILSSDVKVDLIKIDVEGYELEALQGATKMLNANRPVIILEFSPIFYIQDYKEKPLDLVDFLNSLGYEFFTINNTELDLVDWLKNKNNLHSQIDIICRVKN